MERVRLARIVTKAAGGLMTIAEHLAPPDLRRRLSPTTEGDARALPSAPTSNPTSAFA
jgi:hypothetical protein